MGIGRKKKKTKIQKKIAQSQARRASKMRRKG